MALIDVVQNPNDVVVSTVIKMLVNATFIGVVQSLEPSQQRSTTAVRGIGIGDRQIERVWQLSEYTLTVNRMALFGSFLVQALYDAQDPASAALHANWRMLAELRFPIDIEEQILNTSTGAVVRDTFYRGCYMNNISAPRSITSDIIVFESANFDVTSIDDGVNSPLTYATGI